MLWTKRDIFFFKLILKYAIPELSSHVNEIAPAFDANPQALNVRFGIYNKDNSIFTWLNGTNRFFYDTLKTDITLFYEFKNTVRKLFKTTVKLPSKYALVIPYFMYIVLSSYIILPINNESTIEFSLVKLNIPKNISIEDLYHVTYQLHTRHAHRPTRKRRTYRK